MMSGPKIDVDSVEHSQQRETPRDTLNDGAVSVFCELIDDCTEEEEMDCGPVNPTVVSDKYFLNDIDKLTRSRTPMEPV